MWPTLTASSTCGVSHCWCEPLWHLYCLCPRFQAAGDFPFMLAYGNLLQPTPPPPIPPQQILLLLCLCSLLFLFPPSTDTLSFSSLAHLFRACVPPLQLLVPEVNKRQGGKETIKALQSQCRAGVRAIPHHQTQWHKCTGIHIHSINLPSSVACARRPSSKKTQRSFEDPSGRYHCLTNAAPHLKTDRKAHSDKLEENKVCTQEVFSLLLLFLSPTKYKSGQQIWLIN